MSKILVELQSTMGDDRAIAEAAWTSSLTHDAKELRTDEDVARVINMLADSGHAVPFESVILRFWMRIPIFADRQHMTHRIACLAGNTKLWFDLSKKSSGNKYNIFYKTVGDLHDQWVNGISSRTRWGKICRKNHKNRLRKMALRNVNEDTKEIQHTNITNIWSTGVQPVYRFTFSGGYSLDMTTNHRILSSIGWTTMGELLKISTGDLPKILPTDIKFHANGALAYKDGEFVQELKNSGKSILEMSEILGISYHTVRKWLKIHGCSFSKEDTQFKSSAAPWNKGKKYKILKPYIVTDKRRVQYSKLSKENSKFWRGGVTKNSSKVRVECTRGLRNRALYRDNYTCQICGHNSDLEVHHKIPVWQEVAKVAEFDNLQTLCRACHKKQHGFTAKEVLDKRRNTALKITKLVTLNSVEFLGLQPTYDLEVSGPYHNFIADGMCVHNSHNGMSGRYRTMPNDYLDTPEDVASIFSKVKYDIVNFMDDVCEESHSDYQKLVEVLKEQQKQRVITNDELKRAREFIRGILPQNSMAERVTTMNLRSWSNYIRLRLSSHAQPEIREIARQMYRLVTAANICPIALNALNRNGWTLEKPNHDVETIASEIYE